MRTAHRRRLLIAMLALAANIVLHPRRRVYLTRPSLVQPSRSPAAHLLRQRDDKAYISTFGFDTLVFDQLLQQFKPFLPPLPRPRRRPRLLTARLHLALVLTYLTTPQRQKSICLLFGLVPSTLCSSLWTGMRAMGAMMIADPAKWAIKWPSPATIASMAAAVHVREPLLHGVFGFVDRLNLRIFQPTNLDEQNAYYNGWLGDTYCSQVIVFLANDEIAWACSNCPGSWHDAKIAQDLYGLLSNPRRTPTPYCILADSAFPYGKELKGQILSKPKQGSATFFSL